VVTTGALDEERTAQPLLFIKGNMKEDFAKLKNERGGGTLLQRRNRKGASPYLQIEEKRE